MPTSGRRSRTTRTRTSSCCAPPATTTRSRRCDFGEIHVFVGSGYASSCGAALRAIWPRRASASRQRPELLKHGPAAVVWAILDKVVDDYEPVVDGIEDDIEEVETEVFDTTASARPQRIYFLKREVIEFHRAVSPLLAPLEAIERGAFDQIDEELRRYFRDVADHARRVDEMVD